MSGWMTFWTWALLIGLGAFAIVVVTVTVGGLRDIRHMLRTLGDAPDHPGQGFDVPPPRSD